MICYRMMRQKMKEQELTTVNPLNRKVGIKVESNVVSEEILMEDEVSFFFRINVYIHTYIHTYIQYI